MDQALTAHVKILDYSCSQERDAQKTVWLDNCVEELKSGDKWALPALKQIREICCLYEPSPNMNHSQRSHHIYYRWGQSSGKLGFCWNISDRRISEMVSRGHVVAEGFVVKCDFCS